MKTRKIFVCLVLAVLVFSFAATSHAANFTFSNSLNIKVAVTMAYVDANTGAMTTKGWWHIAPGGSTVIKVNANESSGVYYAAYNKSQYLDSSTRSNSQIRRWVNPRTFTYTTNAEPRDSGVWLGTFYKINGRSVNIDSSRAQSGQPSQSTKRAEPRVQDRRQTLADSLPKEYLSNSELDASSRDDLNYLRNRIFANHGYIFSTKIWSDVFSGYDWYKPNPNFSETMFNEYERENLRRILEAIRKK